MGKIVGIESKCACGKTTWLLERNIITPEFADVKTDEIFYNKELGKAPMKDQLYYVQYKVNEFKEKLRIIEETDADIYVDRGVLSPIAFGAGYYQWYGVSEEEMHYYFDECFKLLDTLPEGWQDHYRSIILIPEHDDDIKKRIVSRGRDFEVNNLDGILNVNNFYFVYLIQLLTKYGIPFDFEMIRHKEKKSPNIDKIASILEQDITNEEKAIQLDELINTNVDKVKKRVLELVTKA